MRILITGGGSDIGFAIAQRRIRRGDQVVVTASSPASLEGALERFRQADLPAMGIVLDLSSPVSCEAALTPHLASGLDGLILNACTRIRPTHRFHEIPEERLRTTVEANLLGNAWLIRKLLPGMLERRLGRIVFVSSVAVTMGSGRYSDYTLVKSAMEGLIRSLAVDYGEFNILSNTVRLGFFKTSRTQRFWARDWYLEKLHSILPQGKIGEPDQAAEALDSLLSPTQYINGAELDVSGGFPMLRLEGVLSP